MTPVLPVLTAIAWVTVGAVIGALGARNFYQRAVISAGRAARGPVCNSCPFVTPEQRDEIRNGLATEAPPPLPALPLLDGSGMHRAV